MLIASVTQSSMLLGLISAFFGMLVSMPGYDNSSGQQRLTFNVDLRGGLHPLSRAYRYVCGERGLRLDPAAAGEEGGISLAGTRILMGWWEFRSHVGYMLRSSVIGTWIGIPPGVGANIASILAYTAAKNTSRERERFGSGAPGGIVASESGNNATVGGALVPLFATGIPGSVIDAILIGAFTIHGIVPEPLLFAGDASLVYTLMGSYLAANVIMFFVMAWVTPYIVRLVDVAKHILLPIIALSCIVGWVCPDQVDAYDAFE